MTDTEIIASGLLMFIGGIIIAHDFTVIAGALCALGCLIVTYGLFRNLP